MHSPFTNYTKVFVQLALDDELLRKRFALWRTALLASRKPSRETHITFLVLHVRRQTSLSDYLLSGKMADLVEMVHASVWAESAQSEKLIEWRDLDFQCVGKPANLLAVSYDKARPFCDALHSLSELVVQSLADVLSLKAHIVVYQRRSYLEYRTEEGETIMRTSYRPNSQFYHFRQRIVSLKDVRRCNDALIQRYERRGRDPLVLFSLASGYQDAWAKLDETRVQHIETRRSHICVQFKCPSGLVVTYQ